MDVLDVKHVPNKCKYCDFDRALLNDQDTIHHCRVCDKCVHFMDHHCGFTSNCVGIKNLKAFFLFTFYVSISAFLGLYVLVVNFYLTNTKRSDNDGIRSLFQLVYQKFTIQSLTF